MKLRSPLPQRKTRLEIIPLIDIMFFLLASFMLVSLSMAKLRTIKVDLPVAAASKADIKPDTIDIGINAAGDYFFGTQPMSLPELERTLTERHAQDPNTPVYISADENTRHGSVMFVHGIASRLGYTKIAHRTKKPETK
ncbi:MAG TPA: biopolymer transporter ExbD [Verrucomicrobiales bacterium]|jgi:biopolymer transport protein ExbD|nr:biopolymer transporter ExbD [Verrucomicrobiales bacterium]